MHLLDVVRSWRDSRRLVLLIVAVALLLDNMLLTTVGEWGGTPYRFSPTDRCTPRSAHHPQLPV